jgi:hypothetical protein
MNRTHYHVLLCEIHREGTSQWEQGSWERYLVMEFLVYEWCWCSLFLGVLYQVQMQDSGPGLLKPSQTLSLTFSVSGFTFATYHILCFIKLHESSLLDHCHIECWKISYNPAIKSRANNNRDLSQTHNSLLLKIPTSDDTLMYVFFQIHCKETLV